MVINLTPEGPTIRKVTTGWGGEVILVDPPWPTVPKETYKLLIARCYTNDALCPWCSYKGTGSGGLALSQQRVEVYENGKDVGRQQLVRSIFCGTCRATVVKFQMEAVSYIFISALDLQGLKW